MFKLPPNGINISINEHNCDRSIFSDWIEANVIFSKDPSISLHDIVDILTEESLYRDQNYALEFVQSCCTMIQERHVSFGQNQIFEIKPNRIKRIINWENFPSYSFCLAVSLKTYYEIKITKPKNYTNIQGEIFERISQVSIQEVFPDWKVYYVGWSRINKKNFSDLLDEICNNFNVNKREDAATYYSARQNDAKLDILISKCFADGFCSIPIILFQCASGNNWPSKRNEPNLALWGGQLINFNSKLQKGLTIPFSLEKDEFKFHHPYVEGFLMDRMRILSAYATKRNYIDVTFKNEINNFSRKIIKKIPRLN